MKKTISILCAIILTSIVLPGCVTKRDFCECVDLTKAVTDQYMLSENERIKKEKECKWIQEELSPAEILQKTAECWGSKSSSDSLEKELQEKSVDNNSNVADSNISPSPYKPEDNPTTEKSENQKAYDSGGLKFMVNNLHKTAKDIDLLSNSIIKSRLQNLLGSRFSELQNIFDNSITSSSEVVIPYKDSPSEIEITLLDENDPNGTNAIIVIDYKRDFINVMIRKNGKGESFYENGTKSKLFRDFYNY
jgi:hypothetical protein